MRKVVVTGVSGALGSRVARRLLSDPGVESVVGFDAIAPERIPPRLEMHVVDLTAPEAGYELERAMEGADSVIHLAWRDYDEGGSSADNRRALTTVLEAVDKAGVPSFVHLSSATVYGAWPDNKIPLTEDARLRPNPEFPFAVTKAEAERVVAEWADGHPSVAVAVLRPAPMVGAEDKPLYEALGIIRAPGRGEGGRLVQYLHVDDLASAAILAASKGLSGVFNVAPDGGVTEDAARALAGGVARVNLPERLAGAVSSLGWRLLRRGVPAEALAYATHPWVVAPDRLKGQGWVAAYSSEEALVATDQRLHWDDLPPGRRQNYNLLVAAVGVTVLVGGVLELLRRSRRRSG